MSILSSSRGFWAELPRPVIALAPVADITDAAFRLLIARLGKPDVMYTEFVSVDGLCSPGREHLLRHLRFDRSERPVVAQFFGSKPEHFRECAALAGELGFDGVDINMGCPVKVICKQGAGAALMSDPSLAVEIVQATIEGAGELPVSVKTRIGYTGITLEQWAKPLIEARPAAIVFHLRTKKEMYKPPAHWEVMPELVAMARGTGVLVIGNGDVRSLSQARELAAETGADGVMMGRAAFGNPWLFDPKRSVDDIDLNERLKIMQEHALLFKQVFAEAKRFIMMRRHLMAYASGFTGARELRVLLQNVNSPEDVTAAIESFRSRYGMSS